MTAWPFARTHHLSNTCYPQPFGPTPAVTPFATLHLNDPAPSSQESGVLGSHLQALPSWPPRDAAKWQTGFKKALLLSCCNKTSGH